MEAQLSQQVTTFFILLVMVAVAAYLFCNGQMLCSGKQLLAMHLNFYVNTRYIYQTKASLMVRAIILDFPSNQLRTDFISTLNIADYTLHNEKPVLYCKLTKAETELAVTNFGARDISYDDPHTNLPGDFLEIISI